MKKYEKKNVKLNETICKKFTSKVLSGSTQNHLFHTKMNIKSYLQRESFILIFNKKKI